MADPSRTTWPDWAPRPVLCCYCGARVTLKQAHRSVFQAGVGLIWHSGPGGCDPFTVTIKVETRAALRPPKVASD